MRTITEIFIHVADTPDGMDIGVKTICNWHTWPKLDKDTGRLRHKGVWYDSDADLPVFVQGKRGRDWSDIGYGWVLRRSGIWEEGRPKKLVGAHALRHNTNSIGLCIVGRGFNITPVQWKALKEKIKELLGNNPNAKVRGHNEVNPQKPWCPGFDVQGYMKENFGE